jgi:ABC-2 type transport system permease protein
VNLLNKIFAFFLRDFTIGSSYRSAFILQLFESLFGVASCFYLSRFVESAQLDRSLPSGHSYFAFVLIGFAFFDYMNVSLNSFDQGILQARQNGTLEALLVTETSLPVILMSSAVYPFVLMSFRTLVYMAWAAALFGFRPTGANWLGAALVLAMSILAFIGMGIFSAAYLLLFKQSNPGKWMLMAISGVLGGLMYPVSILPHWLQVLARLLPITYSLEGLRAALLDGASFAALWTTIMKLLVFAAILLPVSFYAFAWALRRTKINGTLSHF